MLEVLCFVEALRQQASSFSKLCLVNPTPKPSTKKQQSVKQQSCCQQQKKQKKM